MAKRYENRYGRGSHRRDRESAEDRGYVDRATDEVRAWFGDDDAERRRHMDEQRDRERYYQDRSRGERSRTDWNRSESNRDDWNREQRNRDWSRGQWARGERDRDDWNRPQYRTGPEDWRGGQHEDVSRYGERGRNWALSDWDRDREWDQDRNREWDRDREWFDRDRERDWRSSSSSRDTSMNRYGGSTWAADEGRMQFGGPTPGIGARGSSETARRWGRGPKGYQRSDTRIHEDVCERISFANVDASDVEVSVSNGEVTLSGTVRERSDKHRIEDVAEEVAGVRDVHNNVRVHRPDRGIGQSDSSGSDQPGTVLGVNPTAEANITDPASAKRRT